MARSRKYIPGQLLKKSLQKNHEIAFVCSPRLGDTLIGLVTVNNLLLNGYQVTVYGNYAFQLKDWFPHFQIHPAPTLDSQYALQKYATVLHMYENDFSKYVALWHPHSIALSNCPLYLADMTMVDIQALLCRQELGLAQITRTNNLVPLPHLVRRKYSQRIVIHPTSFLVRKNWPAKKFVKLAKLLQNEDYKIEFMVAPNELKDWLWLNDLGFALKAFSSLSEAAAFLYESAYFIGNDSGIGHLASNVDLPTVSIILRKGVAKQWRPSWSLGKVVLSPAWINPRPVKEKLWKIFTTVSAVKKVFDKLVVENNQSV